MTYIETEYYEVGEITPIEKKWGSFIHLSVLFIFIFSVFGIFVPLITKYLNSESKFVQKQGSEALNLAINIILINILAVIIFKSYLAVIVTMGVFIYTLYNTILAFKLARKGITYKYPYIYRFLKNTI